MNIEARTSLALGGALIALAMGILFARPSLSNDPPPDDCCTTTNGDTGLPIICAIGVGKDERISLSFQPTDAVLRTSVTFEPQFGNVDVEGVYTPPSQYPGYDVDFVKIYDATGTVGLLPIALVGFTEYGSSEWAQNAAEVATYQSGTGPITAPAYVKQPDGTRTPSQNVRITIDNPLLKLCGKGSPIPPSKIVPKPGCLEGTKYYRHGAWHTRPPTYGDLIECGYFQFTVDAGIKASLLKAGIDVSVGMVLRSVVTKRELKLKQEKQVEVSICKNGKKVKSDLLLCTRLGVQYLYDPKWGAVLIALSTANPTTPIWGLEGCISI